MLSVFSVFLLCVKKIVKFTNALDNYLTPKKIPVIKKGEF